VRLDRGEGARTITATIWRWQGQLGRDDEVAHRKEANDGPGR